MQDPSLYSQIKAQAHNPQPQFPEQEHLKCPRCDSTNTKFCYYNNYNLSQPRHFCKNCRRYWTKGGALRNIPVGGGSRKNSKRSSSSSSSSSPSASSKRPATIEKEDGKSNNNGERNEEALGMKGGGDGFGGQFGNLMDVSGSFSQLLGGASGGQFGNLLDGMGSNGSGLEVHNNEPFLDPGQGQNLDPGLGLENGSGGNGDGFLNIHQSGEEGSWSGNSNGWPDLAIYTPGSTFH